MRRFLLFLLSLGIGFGVFWLITGNIGWQAISQPLLLFQHWQGIVIFLLTLAIAIANIWRWRFILKSQAYNFSLKGLSDIWSAGFAITYLTPVALFGGEIFMALALKKRFSLPWQKNIASLAVLKILNLSIILLFLTLGIFAFLVLKGLPSEKIVLISTFIVLGLTAILALFYYRSFQKKSILTNFLKIFTPLEIIGVKKKQKENPKGKPSASYGAGKSLTGFGKKITLNNQAIIETEKEVFSFFKSKNKAMWQGLGLAFVSSFLNLARFWFIVFFLKGAVINLFQALAIFAFVNMAYILPFPAALGSLEASQVYVFNSLGLGPELGTAFSLILRGAELSLAFIGLFFFIKLWLKFRAFTWLLEKFGITKKG